MESTGVYWIPVFEILEARGFDVLLVNARDVKQVPGRKTDVNDAQWLQQLHQYGLLRGSFRPRDAVVQLRAYLRHRERLVEYAAAHIQHMQKALMQMNVQLHHAVTDITGATGMRIIRAIIAGHHAPETLASYRDVRCASSEETLRAALTGNYRPEHVFALRQAVELYDVHQAKIADCDVEVEAVLRRMNDARPTPVAPLPASRHLWGVHHPLPHHAGVQVFEVNRPDRSRRRRLGKSDPTDAENAARAVLAGDAHGAPNAERPGGSPSRGDGRPTQRREGTHAGGQSTARLGGHGARRTARRVALAATGLLRRPVRGLSADGRDVAARVQAGAATAVRSVGST